MAPSDESYKNYLMTNAPGWFTNGSGEAWLEEHGQIADDTTDRLKAAVKARMPTEAPVDALGHIGAERMIDRGAFEDDATFAERLRQAWEAWPFAGTARGILSQLWAAGYTFSNGNPTIVQQNGLAHFLVEETHGASLGIAPTPDRYTEGGDGLQLAIVELNEHIITGAPWWLFGDDGSADRAHTSRFMLVFPGQVNTDPVDCFPQGWTDAQATLTTSTAPTLAEVNAIRRIVNRWRAARSQFIGIVAIESNFIWGWPCRGSGELRRWGDGNVWGGGAVFWGPDEE